VTDGLSNTIAVVEMRTTNSSWAAPTSVDISQLSAGLPQTNHPGGGQVLMGDGSVRFISQSIDPQVLKSLSTRNGAETVGNF
jgi:prepilin-type processing-associated H-X9-DG protein